MEFCVFFMAEERMSRRSLPTLKERNKKMKTRYYYQAEVLELEYTDKFYA